MLRLRCCVKMIIKVPKTIKVEIVKDGNIQNTQDPRHKTYTEAMIGLSKRRKRFDIGKFRWKRRWLK